jgi:anti-sigma regulatory factor (Ser/Thr protein kinase)
MRCNVMILESSDASPALARTFCEDVLGDMGCDEALIDDARLVVSELVTNAVVHAHTPIELNLFVKNNALRIEVTDFGLDRPHVWAHTAGGHGIPIVEALAQGWGVVDLGSGKTVWCELSLDAWSRPNADRTRPRDRTAGQG